MFPLVFLVVASTLSFGTIKAQTSDVTCWSGYDWAKNFRGQTPCTVAAILQTVAACNPNGYTIRALAPGDQYTGPATDPSTQNACICSTVMYGLVSACGACQGASWIGWDAWSANCPRSLITISYYSQYIPENTAIPAWAFYNPSFSGDSYSPLVARNIADYPWRVRDVAASPPILTSEPPVFENPTSTSTTSTTTSTTTSSTTSTTTSTTTITPSTLTTSPGGSNSSTTVSNPDAYTPSSVGSEPTLSLPDGSEPTISLPGGSEPTISLPGGSEPTISLPGESGPTTSPSVRVPGSTSRTPVSSFSTNPSSSFISGAVITFFSGSSNTLVTSPSASVTTTLTSDGAGGRGQRSNRVAVVAGSTVGGVAAVLLLGGLAWHFLHASSGPALGARIPEDAPLMVHGGIGGVGGVQAPFGGDGSGGTGPLPVLFGAGIGYGSASGPSGGSGGGNGDGDQAPFAGNGPSHGYAPNQPPSGTSGPSGASGSGSGGGGQAPFGGSGSGGPGYAPNTPAGGLGPGYAPGHPGAGGASGGQGPFGGSGSSGPTPGFSGGGSGLPGHGTGFGGGSGPSSGPSTGGLGGIGGPGSPAGFGGAPDGLGAGPIAGIVVGASGTLLAAGAVGFGVSRRSWDEDDDLRSGNVSPDLPVISSTQQLIVVNPSPTTPMGTTRNSSPLDSKGARMFR